MSEVTKEEKYMMDADIRLVRLTRTTLKGKKTLPNPKSWFVADYFDVMEIDSLSLEDSFAEWLGFESDVADDSIITEQSYTLYCSPNMLIEYEGNIEKSYRGDPFVKEEKNDCLSIIHVYILPEIMARMNISRDDVCSDRGILLQPFVEDLYDILDLYAEKNVDESFTARVYVMLSAGDFAIVIRSRRPDTAYSISTYLRKRKAGKEQASCGGSEYVIYKTYTLSTIGRKIIHVEDEHGNLQKQDRFIVRGCYSNKYWKEQEDVRKFQENLSENVEELHPLSGRYDFTVRLREDEFYQIMSFSDNEAQTEVNQSARVKCMKYFIDQEYLTSINERYLMDSAELGSKLTDQEVMSRSIFLSDKGDEGDDLLNKNGKQITILMEKYEMIVGKSRNIIGYRKNIQQYLYLLKRQIILCKNINELSDTRIYAKVLIELLSVILNSVEQYVELCSQSEKDIWLNALENNLRKSIVTLDSYAQYIRNNNLQSMQTPNYNIETSMSTEKILIGYSELLWRFIEFYKNTIKETSMKEYLAVMVPNLNSSNLNIDVMFREEESQDKRLIVIGSPTLEEITDFPIIFPALFHEVAHQFRYESRERRNRAVLKATIKEVMCKISQYFSQDVVEKTGVSKSELYVLRDGLEKILTELFVAMEDGDKLTDKSLTQFETWLFDDIDAVFSVWKWKSDLEERVRDYIFELRYEMDYADEEMRGWIIKLQGCLRKNFEENSKDSLKENSESVSSALNRKSTINKIIKYAFQIAGKCVYHYIKDVDGDNRKVLDLAEDENRDWEAEWKKYCENGMCDKYGEVRKINRIFLRFLDSMDEYEEKCRNRDSFIETDWNNRVSQVKELEGQLYKRLKVYWEEVAKQSAAAYNRNAKFDSKDIVKMPVYRNWIRVGRYLGLDHEIKESKFSEALKAGIYQEDCVSPSFLGLYREETADLLMCNVMGMEPTEYVSLMASLFVPVDNRYAGTDIERVFCVLYFQWCYDLEKEEKEKEKAAFDRYLQICCDIFSKTRSNAQKLLTAIGMADAAENLPCGEIICGESENDHKESEDIIEKNISYLLDCRKIIQKETYEQEMVKAMAELDNVIRVYDLLIDLMWGGKYYCDNLQKEVVEDMARGKKRLAGLSAEAQSSPVVKEIFDAGAAITKYLSQSYSQEGIGGSKKAEGGYAGNMRGVNEKCVEILLMMYYHNKIRIAQEGREEITNEN